VPQEKNAKMIISSRKSWSPLGSSPRMNGTPPPLIVCPTGSLPPGIASSSAAVSTNDAAPPQSRAIRIARGT
jgi:hypothetical protein